MKWGHFCPTAAHTLHAYGLLAAQSTTSMRAAACQLPYSGSTAGQLRRSSLLQTLAPTAAMVTGFCTQFIFCKATAHVAITCFLQAELALHTRSWAAITHQCLLTQSLSNIPR